MPFKTEKLVEFSVTCTIPCAHNSTNAQINNKKVGYGCESYPLFVIILTIKIFTLQGR